MNMIATTAEVLIGGLRCRTDDADLARCFENVVSQGFCPGEDAAATRTIDWESLTKPPDWSSAGALASTTEAPVRRWGRVCGSLYHERPLFQISGRAGCCLASSHHVCVFGTPEPANPAWMELLAVVVLELLAATGTLAMHAGAATVDGYGALIAGPSGSGKSTLVYLLAQAGASYATDDVALISWQGDTWAARSTGEHLRLHPAMKIDDGLMHSEGPDALGKLRLHPRRPGVCRPSTRIERLVFLESVHGTETTWRPLGREQSVERLMAEAALALSPAVAGRQLVSLSKISRLPAVTLRTGRDLIAQPGLASSIFADIRRPSRP